MAEKWKKRPSLGRGRAGHDVATAAGWILVMGGFQHNPPTPSFDSVEARRLGGGAWRDLPPMITARNNLAAAALSEAVYALGGVKSTNADPFGVVVDAAEKFSPIRENSPLRKAEWTAIPDLVPPRTTGAAAGLGGRVYLAGGFLPENGNDTMTSSVVAFDPGSPEAGWQEVAALPAPRGFLRMVAVGQHLYAIGGMNEAETNVSTVERYDPAADAWETVAPMNQERGLPGVAVLNVESRPLIVVVGGMHAVAGDFANGTLQDSTEVYDIAENVWRLHPARLPQARASLVCAAGPNDNVLAIGGFVGPNVPDTGDVHTLKIKSEDLPTTGGDLREAVEWEGTRAGAGYPSGIDCGSIVNSARVRAR